MTSEGYIKTQHIEPLDVYFSVNYILYNLNTCITGKDYWWQELWW